MTSSLEAPPATDKTAESSYISVSGVAEITSLSVGHLNKLRMQNSPDSPPFFKVGRRCLYPVSGIHAWAEARMTANAGAGR